MKKWTLMTKKRRNFSGNTARDCTTRPCASLCHQAKRKKSCRRPDDEWALLKRICINKSIDFLRREKRFVNIDDAFTSAESVLADGNEEVWSSLDGQVFPMVMEALKAMPDGYRTILTLKLIEDIDYKEIASMLGISESSVRSQYMRGRKKLAEKLKEKLKFNDYE